MAKRKAETTSATPRSLSPTKKRNISNGDAKSRFRDGLFDDQVLQKYKAAFETSSPYKHAVISGLVEPSLLRSVRNEILENISFTPKETDIYKIHQSGDLANLDGLDDSSLSHLPSLLKLRDAIYSQEFRNYLSSISGCGPLSGKKKDLAINTYLPGCHLLCHDDVIGSRRVSYILYLTDPDKPWKPEWGGALRLYPTKTVTDENGKEIIIPQPDVVLSHPPAFNQLSFFTVQPGLSFHDVEEVYVRDENENEDDDGRIRMAISGWFHIPQKGEDGYIEGLEEEWVATSGLGQLQAKTGKFDKPQPQIQVYGTSKNNNGKAEEVGSKGKGKAVVSTEKESEESTPLTDKDFDFLLQYIAPSYLTPDIAEELEENFENDSSLRLDEFLSPKFTKKLHEYIEKQDSQQLPDNTTKVEKETEWSVALPPHKQKYLYQQPRMTGTTDSKRTKTPLQEIIENLLPSAPFRKWLSLVTGGPAITSSNVLARRFRRGIDYTLATGLDDCDDRLEITLGITPSPGWEEEGEDEDDTDEEKEDVEMNDADSSTKLKEKENSKHKENGTSSSSKANPNPPKASNNNDKDNDTASIASVSAAGVGGYEVYMSGEDDSASVKDDPAVYNAADDDGVLFSMAAGWNRLSIVLRDKGTLKFVKYVSRTARGDRWDVSGEYGVRWEE
ncbi:MAG: hypothetical protein M1834_005178 [Cirrosporium novae-zelandiae]|nr:MAG: hypothetical protein M1834_005178 [Cirrosporium novae-zelandiae]